MSQAGAYRLHGAKQLSISFKKENSYDGKNNRTQQRNYNQQDDH